MNKRPAKARSWFAAHGTAGFVIAGLCAAFALLVVIGKISPLANVPKWDETACAYNAQRVLSGQIPYRDFFNFIPPGSFLLQAGWYALWGGKASLTLGRYLAVLVALLSWLSLWRTLKRARWSWYNALLLSTLYPAAIYVFWPIPSHHWFAVLPLFLSFEAYDFEEKRVRGLGGWLWCGLMGGIAVLFLQTLGLYAALFWGTVWILGGEKKLSRAAAALGGASMAVFPVAGWLWTKGALLDSFRDTILWPMRNYGAPGGPNAVRLLGDLPSRVASLWAGAQGYSAWLWVPFAVAGTILYLVLLAAFLFCLWLAFRTLARSLRARKLPAPMVSAAMVFTLVAVSLFLKGKTDWLHMVYQLGPIGLAWCAALGPVAGGKPGRNVNFSLVLAALLAACLFYQSGYLVFHKVHTWEFTDVDRPVREAPVNRYLRSRPWLKPDDTIVALPEGGQVYLYVRPAAIGYTLLTPLSEHYNTLEDHEIAAEQMEKNRPRCVVMTVDEEANYLDPRSPVGRLIRREFIRFARVGNAVIYVRRGTP